MIFADGIQRSLDLFIYEGHRVRITTSSSDLMADIEELRQANILRNKSHLQQLGILHKQASRPVSKAASRPPTKRRKLDLPPPSRSSARIASAPAKPTYNEDETEDKPSRRGAAKAKRGAVKIKAEIEVPTEPAVPVKDIETIRSGWTAWKPEANPPTRDDDSVFHFSGHPAFTPNKSPEEMLREGCFGGSYFRPLFSRRLGCTIQDDYKELPASWYEGLDVGTFLTSPDYDPEVNKYKVKCGQSIEEWEAAGWISHDHDVRGWFQWYCRFFMGRRCEDDERQIGRWARCAGESGRWRRSLLKKYVSMGVKEVFDDGEDEEQGDVSPVQHQTCFQWAYE